MAGQALPPSRQSQQRGTRPRYRSDLPRLDAGPGTRRTRPAPAPRPLPGVLVLPLLTLEGFHLHLSAIRSLADKSLRNRAWEGTLLFAHVFAYLGALFLVLPPTKAIAFLVVHQGLFGIYLGSIFAPNHKGMPTVRSTDGTDYLRRQVLTSRDVRGGRLTDIVLGGLNYQIEHHLFPSMPSPHLRKAQGIVRSHCAELGISHLEVGLVASYRQSLASLHSAGTAIRGARTT